jgi:hypothetical protein
MHRREDQPITFRQFGRDLVEIIVGKVAHRNGQNVRATGQFVSSRLRSGQPVRDRLGRNAHAPRQLSLRDVPLFEQ